MSKFNLSQQPTLFGVSHEPNSYHVEKLIEILGKYIPIDYLIDTIVECLDLRIMMNILIRNSEVLSTDDEIDVYTHPSAYSVYKHVNQAVVNLVACNPHPFVHNTYRDKCTLPLDIKEFILTEDPNLQFGNTCRIDIISKEITVSTNEYYDESDKVDVFILLADTRDVVYHISFD